MDLFSEAYFNLPLAIQPNSLFYASSTLPSILSIYPTERQARRHVNWLVGEGVYDNVRALLLCGSYIIIASSYSFTAHGPRRLDQLLDLRVGVKGVEGQALSHTNHRVGFDPRGQHTARKTP